MCIEKHPRYKKFSLSPTANDCGIHEKDMSFVIFNNDYLLRGHVFHFITPAEYGIGFGRYNQLDSNTIKELHNKLTEIKCPYISHYYEDKAKCKQCNKKEAQRYNECTLILTADIISIYVEVVAQTIDNILMKPRFARTLRTKPKEFIGLCDNRIKLVSILMDDRITYNVVTAHVPDPYTSGNTLKYMINKVSGDIEKKASQPKFCTDYSWDRN